MSTTGFTLKSLTDLITEYHCLLLSIRKDIVHGTAPQEIGKKASTNVCVECRTLLDLKPSFETFVQSGRALSRHRAVYTKPTSTDYCDLNNFRRPVLVKAYIGVFLCLSR